VTIVRPDRCVLAEGPMSGVEAMLQQALDRIAPATSMSSVAPGASLNERSTQHAA
jgi:hypothetical protein